MYRTDGCEEVPNPPLLSRPLVLIGMIGLAAASISIFLLSRKDLNPLQGPVNQPPQAVPAAPSVLAPPAAGPPAPPAASDVIDLFPEAKPLAFVSMQTNEPREIFLGPLPDLKALLPGKRVRLRIFEEQNLQGRLEDVGKGFRDTGNVAVCGYLDEGMGSFAFVGGEGGLLGAVRVFGEYALELRPRTGGMYSITPLPVTSGILCGTVTAGAESGDQLPPPSPGPFFVDVLVCYTDTAAEEAGGVPQLRTRVMAALADADLAFADAGVPLSFRVPKDGFLRVPYRESGKLSVDLSLLEGHGDGVMDDVHVVRNRVRADLVTLIVGPGDLNGLAAVLAPATPAGEAMAFSVVCWYALPKGVLCHEMAHNFGCDHDPAGGPAGAGAKAYAHGQVLILNGVRYLTIMATGSGRPLPFFSNPAKPFRTVPRGTPNLCDNSRRLRETAELVSQFR